ncbi:MAG: OB-fold nucleic acid binding domain-containing protein [Bacteroidetes bacterium]|nr:OB-fold nucleic acid binding domain-containing protein [Bacteroidota bacterium]
MIKNLFLLVIPFLFLFASCNQATKDAETKKADTATLAVKSFIDSAAKYVEKPIRIEGMVLHTCKHGGKRMFLVDGSDTIRVEVTTGNNIPKFDESLIGSRVKVLGILKEERVDAKYLNEWEAEVKKPAEDHNTGIHTGAKGHEDQGTKEKLDEINSLRDDLKKSGKDHLSFYSIEAISYTVVK